MTLSFRVPLRPLTVLVFCFIALSAAAQFEEMDPICHYFSYEGCLANCYRLRESGQITYEQFTSCNVHCYDSCYEEGPRDPWGTDTQDPFCCSPLVVDLGEKGFTFTGSDDVVSFDIDADGAPEWISWVNRASHDAFIALDRNADGRINSGAELFGNKTPQPASTAPNGFRALAVFDAASAGGNGDGMISSQDAIWSKLLLWTDHSHDGVSQETELSPVSASGIVSISLDYKESMRRDRYGNGILYRGKVIDAGGSGSRDVVDVFFVRR